MQRRLFLSAAVLPMVVLTTALAAPNAVLPAPAAQGAASQAGSLATGLVSLREVQDIYAADAVIEAVRQATVSAQIAGNVTQFHVDAGDRVRRGQVLARIDTRDSDAQVTAGRAGVAQADAALNQAKLNFERTERLVKQGFISQAALDKADADLKTAQAALEVARAGSTQAVTARSFAELRAPIDGVVSQRLMELGELAAPGKPVLMLHDPSQLRAVGAVPQFVLPKLAAARAAAPAMTAQVELPSLGRQITASRLTVLPTADARLLSTVVRADLGDAATIGLVPGTAAKILLPVGQAKKLVMPAAAVLRRGELVGAYVVAADGRPQLRQIRVGEPVADGLIEVLAGVADGERVALDPLAASGARR
jgi:RND family efflux transporter MFP subunit